MNLLNMQRNLQAISKRFQLGPRDSTTIGERLGIVLEGLNSKYRPREPVVRFPSRQWWETVEEQTR